MYTKIYDPGRSIGHSIGRVSRALGNRLKRSFQSEGIGISQEQWMMLVFLQDKDGATQQQMAEILGKDKTTITRLVDSMEKNGLLKRVRGEQDRRSRHIYMTQQGRSTLESLSVIAGKTLEEAKAGISEDKMKICREVLDELYLNLKSPK